MTLPEPSPASRIRLPRWLTGRDKVSSIVVVGALLAGVLVASFGVGYTATSPKLDTGTNNVTRNGSVVQLNSETQRVEAEARDLAPGNQEIEVVTLRDGRVVSVNHKTGQVLLLDPSLVGSTEVTHPGAVAPDGTHLAVLAAPDAGYLIEPDQDAVEQVGGPAPPVTVPGGLNKSAKEWVPDGTAGIWVLTGDEKAAHIVAGKVIRVVEAAEPIKHLTFADGRPIAITASGLSLDIAADPIRTVGTQPMPSSQAVVPGSPKGSGRYLVVVDRKDGLLVVTDPRTGAVQRFTNLPTGNSHILGEPVVLDDRIYVPDYRQHLLYVFDVATHSRLKDIEVPGKDTEFSLEVHEHKVWANDQHDAKTLVVGRDGSTETIGKGNDTGLTDTTNHDKQQPTRSPAPDPTPSPTTKPASPSTSSTPRPLVTVPVIPAGTSSDDACARIKAANLRCEPQDIGPGGPTGSLRDTTPAGGSRVPEQSIVRIAVYGPVSVPGVVGQHTTPACDRIAGARFTCDKQPMPGSATTFSDLDVVADQNPQAGQRIDLGAAVTVRFWNQVPMPDLVGHNGAQECGRIVAETNQKVTCEVAPGPEAPTPAQTGTVANQSVPAGTPVQVGGAIKLTVYGNQIQRVPLIPPGTQLAPACQMVQASGYTCNPIADGLSRTAGVTSQDPPGNTPQAGGTVNVHYEPTAAAALYLFKHPTQPTYAIRFRTTLAGYDLVRQLGWAYDTNQQQPGTGLVNGYYCGSNTQECFGHNPNHYYSRGGPTGWPGWNADQAMYTFNPVNGNCPAPGQIPMNRFGELSSTVRTYTIGQTPPSGFVYNYTEPLGCIWAP